MALLGKGMLAVFNEVRPRDERDFNEWYNREHIDERVALPGFRRARRYVAVDAEPKYLATYECARVGDLSAPGYLKLLANQSPWSQRVMARFTSFSRMTLRIEVDLTHGYGGALSCVRFVPDPKCRTHLATWLRERALPQAIARPGMLGAAAAFNDLTVANAPAKGGGFAYPTASVSTWLVMLEGSDAEVTAKAARALFKTSALKPFGVEAAPTIGSYRFLFGDQR